MIDIIMSLVTAAFVYSLIPQIVKSLKEEHVALSYQTLFISWMGIGALSVCFFIIEKPITGCANCFTALCWLCLTILRFKFDKQSTANKDSAPSRRTVSDS